MIGNLREANYIISDWGGYQTSEFLDSTLSLRFVLMLNLKQELVLSLTKGPHPRQNTTSLLGVVCESDTGGHLLGSATCAAL